LLKELSCSYNTRRRKSVCDNFHMLSKPDADWKKQKQINWNCYIWFSDYLTSRLWKEMSVPVEYIYLISFALFPYLIISIHMLS
jgi:hypothetical protein